MKTNYIFVLLVILLVSGSLFTSCKKDETSSMEGTYSFTSVSTENEIYGFIKQNGEIIEVPTADIDMSLFADIDNVYQLDNITILPDNRISYTAYEIYDFDGIIESHAEESDYTINGNHLEFTYIDEFGNEELCILVIEDEQLALQISGRVDKENDTYQDMSKFFNNPNFGIAKEGIINRIETRGLQESYQILYHQIYTKQ